MCTKKNMAKKQAGNERKRRKAERIIGKTVTAIFLNGDLPHNIGLAWVKDTSGAYFVNFKKHKAIEYVRDGKFIIRKATKPLRVFVRNAKPQTEADLMALELMQIEAEREADQEEEYRQMHGPRNIDNMTLYEKYTYAARNLREEVNNDAKYSCMT